MQGSLQVHSILLNNKYIFRRELGEDLEIKLLEMAVEEQEERVRTRHEGSQHAVDIMRVGSNISDVVIVTSKFCNFVIIMSLFSAIWPILNPK